MPCAKCSISGSSGAMSCTCSYPDSSTVKSHVVTVNLSMSTPARPCQAV